MKWDIAQLKEDTVATTPIFSGRVISLQVDEVRLPNGQLATREIVKHPGAVAVMALQDDRLLVVAQYRKPLEKVQVEIPAGKLERNEQPELAAYRELEEETGMRARSMQHVCSFFTSPGFADECLHLYFTADLEVGERNPDDDEFIESAWITFAEAQQLIRDGAISDAKTMLAVFAWQTYRLTGRIRASE
jgi:ADP-ribose pyrophosphatase